MAGQIRLDDLDAAVERAAKLKELLASPEVLAFAEVAQQQKEPILLLSEDRLVLASEAARLLGVNKQRLSNYVQQGLLKPWYVPGSTSRRFLLSELWQIPQREVANG